MHETKTIIVRVNKELVDYRTGINIGLGYVARGNIPTRKMPLCNRENSVNCRITLGSDMQDLSYLIVCLDELKKEYGSTSSAVNMALSWVHEYAPHLAETHEAHFRAVKYWKEREEKEVESVNQLNEMEKDKERD